MKRWLGVALGCSGLAIALACAGVLLAPADMAASSSSPSPARTVAALPAATTSARHTDEPCAPHFDSSPLRRVRSYLHFIRSSLLAPTS
ncbi:hypothetical protein AAIH17_23995, partial [Pseudomonas aeruginosa]